jgi:hypothetical protein
MEPHWSFPTQPEFGFGSTAHIALNGYEYQADLAPSMDRNPSSHSSMGSANSGYSNHLGQEQNFTASISSGSSYAGSPRSPSSEYASPRKSSYTTRTPAYLSPAQQKPEVEASSSRERRANELPLFNIETDGDPDIKWYMYYDFKVTKKDAYFELQPGYLVTANYPSRIPSEKYEKYARSSRFIVS